MNRALIACLILALGSCGPPPPSVWGLVVDRDRDNITLLNGDEFTEFALRNARVTFGDCVQIELPRGSRPARQVARVPASSANHARHCHPPEVDEIFGYLSCHEEGCTFSSPNLPDVRAEPRFLQAAQQQFNVSAGLPPEAGISESWPYCVRLRGVLGPRGGYGHLGTSNHVLYIFAVDAARNVPDISWCSRENIDRAPASHSHNPSTPFYD